MAKIFLKSNKNQTLSTLSHHQGDDDLVLKMLDIYLFNMLAHFKPKQTLWTVNSILSLKMTRYEFFYSPSTLSILRSSHILPSFSSKSVVGRRRGGEEPGSKGIQSFSKFSLLLYTEKITTGIPVQTENYILQSFVK